MSDSTLTRLFPASRIKAQLQTGIQGYRPEMDMPRRTTHGSHAWSLPSGLHNLRQPQDGVPGIPVQGQDVAAVRKGPNTLCEPEDAHLSGTMRSLARRVLGLNVTTLHKNSPALKQQERYFAEPNLPNLIKGMQRKGHEGKSLTDTPLTHPQVA